MESWGLIVPKFIKFLTEEDSLSNEMKIPKDIVSTYGSRLQPSIMLKFRNGYEIEVVYNEERGTFVGVKNLYEDFRLTGGHMLVFEYNGVSDLNVHVIGKDLREIDYPRKLHYMQKGHPRVVSVKNGGMRFVNFVSEENFLADEFEPPISFKRAFHFLPGYQNMVFSNGKQIRGQYNHEIKKFQGLGKFCSILGMSDFRAYNLLLFTYEEVGLTTVSVFDDNFVEVLFPGTPLSAGLNGHNPSVSGRMEITLKPSHMYKYTYGVDISVEYSLFTNFWKKRDYITVYSGDRAWKLQVRTRGCKYHRAAIKDGWIQFRDNLGLGVGDVLVLECAESSWEHFNVSIIKNPTADAIVG